MKVTREKVQENRQQVIDMAARLLRECGFDGVSLADITKSAGLTNGGFYRHFASKDDLLVKASERAITDTLTVLKNELLQKPADPFRTLIERYVSSAHRDDPGSGCILPALAVDAGRSHDPALREVFVSAIQHYLEQIAALLPEGAEADRGRPPAAILSEMVGAVILSRVVAGTPLADTLLSTVVEDLLAR